PRRREEERQGRDPDEMLDAELRSVARERKHHERSRHRREEDASKRRPCAPVGIRRVAFRGGGRHAKHSGGPCSGCKSSVGALRLSAFRWAGALKPRAPDRRSRRNMPERPRLISVGWIALVCGPWHVERLSSSRCRWSSRWRPNEASRKTPRAWTVLHPPERVRRSRRLHGRPRPRAQPTLPIPSPPRPR